MKKQRTWILKINVVEEEEAGLEFRWGKKWWNNKLSFRWKKDKQWFNDRKI